MQYDLAVAYRIYPGVSKTPAVFPKDKMLLSELALRSFRDSLQGVNAKVYALLDGCPPEYEALFKKYFPSDLEVIHCPRIGNFDTYKRQLDLLSAQDDAPWIYFAEDDYFYLPGKFQTALTFAKSQPDAHFISLYNHVDYDTLDFHRYPSERREFAGQEWRSVATTCLTFLTSRDQLRKSKETLSAYSRGSPDAAMWLNITHRHIWDVPRMIRYGLRDWDYFTFIARSWTHGWKANLFGPRLKLWVPMPGLATHLETTGIAPDRNWPELLKTAERELA